MGERAAGNGDRRTRSRRGRPTPSRLAEIERAILGAGQKLFLAEGYAATSMEAVAAEANVSKGTLYARYSGKDELFKAIASDRLEAWSILAPGPDHTQITGLKDRLLYRANKILEAISLPEVRAFERMMSAEANRFPDLAGAFYDQGYRALITNVEADLVEALGGGAQARAAASATASVFGSALIGWYHIESTAREISPASCRAHAAQVVDLCLKALGLD